MRIFFSWDASITKPTSDVAQQLLRHHLANDTAPSLNVSNIPSAIQDRLDGQVTFDLLPGLLQRALVWDTGYVFNEFNDFVRVRTRNDYPMAKIFIVQAGYESTRDPSVQCRAQVCKQPNGRTYVKSTSCISRTYVNCLVDNFNGYPINDKPMWGLGGQETDIPMFRVLNHSIGSNTSTVSYLPAIHLSADGQEPVINKCAATTEGAAMYGVGATVIPCASPTMFDAQTTSGYKPPPFGFLTAQWLHYIEQSASSSNGTNASSSPPRPSTSTSSSGTNVVTIVTPVVLVVFVLVFGVLCYRRRRSSANSKAPEPISMETEHPYQPPSPVLANKTHTQSSSLLSTAVGSTATTSSHYSVDLNHETTHNALLQSFLGDPCVTEKPIAYEQLEFKEQIAHGSFGELWVGYYNGQLVALKRLVPSKKKSSKEVEAFALEIQLTARLHHRILCDFLVQRGTPLTIWSWSWSIYHLVIWPKFSVPVTAKSRGDSINSGWSVVSLVPLPTFMNRHQLLSTVISSPRTYW